MYVHIVSFMFSFQQRFEIFVIPWFVRGTLGCLTSVYALCVCKLIHSVFICRVVIVDIVAATSNLLLLLIVSLC